MTDSRFLASSLFALSLFAVPGLDVPNVGIEGVSLSSGAEPLLQVITKGQKVVVGWAFERDGGGRAYGTTLGHFYENFEREPFRRMVVNAILWTAHSEVPEGGARVDVGDDVLKLPPERKSE